MPNKSVRLKFFTPDDIEAGLELWTGANPDVDILSVTHIVVAEPVGGGLTVASANPSQPQARYVFNFYILYDE